MHIVRIYYCCISKSLVDEEGVPFYFIVFTPKYTSTQDLYSRSYFPSAITIRFVWEILEHVSSAPRIITFVYVNQSCIDIVDSVI